MVSLLLSDADVRAALDYRELTDSIEAALRAEAAGAAVVPARLNLEYSEAWLRVMPAMVPSAGVMGLKVFYGVPGRGVRYLILLCDMADGSFLAAVDACYLTAARTAAASAVASRYLAPQGVVRLGVIGSGLEAETHCEALCATGEVAEIKVFSPNESRRELFAQRMRSRLGLPVKACGRPVEAVDEADHVVVATNTGPAQSVAYRADWLASGQHLSAIGSTNIRLRELETEVFRRVEVVVFDADPRQIAEESGDLIQYRAEGGDVSSIPTLTDLVGAKVPGRRSREQTTLYKSVGTALQDVAAAELIYRRARQLGLGNEVTDLSQEKTFNPTPTPESAWG